jgi:hypothetical protein
MSDANEGNKLMSHSLSLQDHFTGLFNTAGYKTRTALMRALASSSGYSFIERMKKIGMRKHTETCSSHAKFYLFILLYRLNIIPLKLLSITRKLLPL